MRSLPIAFWTTRLRPPWTGLKDFEASSLAYAVLACPDLSRSGSQFESFAPFIIMFTVRWPWRGSRLARLNQTSTFQQIGQIIYRDRDQNGILIVSLPINQLPASSLEAIVDAADKVSAIW
jgi:hypothetical protein